MIETLENRLLMRRGVISLNDSTLTVSATAGDDVIAMGGNANHLVVILNGRRQTFTDQNIRRVIVYAGGGNDIVDGGTGGYSRLRPLGISAVIDGGTGNDTLASGFRTDTVLGSTGDDQLFDDLLYNQDYQDGGAGDDHLNYGATQNGGRGYDIGTGGNTDLPVVSGLEQLYSVNESYGRLENPGVIDRQQWQGDLTTKGSQLIFRYPTYTGYNVTLTGPTVRSDGMLQITLRRISASNDYVPPTSELTVKLNRDDAMRRGIVLKYDDPSGSFSYLDEQVVMLPSA